MPPGVVTISASSIVLMPFWITVTRAFLTTLPCVDDRLVEGDVVGLPLERRLAGVHRRDDLLVDRAAVVVLGLQAVGVEDLELVDPVQVDAAVAPALSMRLGHVGHVEFQMQLEVAESLVGHDVAAADGDDPVGHRPVGRRLAVALDPPSRLLAVEEDDRPFGRLGPDRGVARLLLGGRRGRLKKAVSRRTSGRDRSERGASIGSLLAGGMIVVRPRTTASDGRRDGPSLMGCGRKIRNRPGS